MNPTLRRLSIKLPTSEDFLELSCCFWQDGEDIELVKVDVGMDAMSFDIVEYIKNKLREELTDGAGSIF